LERKGKKGFRDEEVLLEGFMDHWDVTEEEGEKRE